MNRKTKDRIVDDLLYEAVDLMIEDFDKEFLETEPLKLSDEHDRKMRRLFRRERNKSRIRKALKISCKAACIILAAGIVSAVAICSVEAFKVRFMNFFINITPTHSMVNFSDDDSGDSFYSDKILLDYIPDGFKLEKSSVYDDKIQLMFTNNDYRFSLVSDVIVNSEADVDTENANSVKIMINGHNGLYSSNNNLNILVRRDEELMYRIFGNIERDEIVKIAENVKKP